MSRGGRTRRSTQSALASLSNEPRWRDGWRASPLPLKGTGAVVLRY